ncbi:hypothetical protein [Streptomyces sp. NPDC001930]|uniref:hypothetical protein n=1 Tax=Streptomyces sp. NPDC001930 TaxID=3364625 RepID=UPI003678D4F0
MYAHTTWPPPGGTTGAANRPSADGATGIATPLRRGATGIATPLRRGATGIATPLRRGATTGAANRVPRRAATAPDALGRWGR